MPGWGDILEAREDAAQRRDRQAGAIDEPLPVLRSTRRMRGDAERVPACPVCGNLAKFAADIYVGDILTQRGVWCSEECAGNPDEDAHVRIDKIVDESSFAAVLSAAPCWCGMAEHTVVDFCPKHGNAADINHHGDNDHDLHDHILGWTPRNRMHGLGE